MIYSKLIHFLDNKSILGWIISQNSGCYPTKDKKGIRKLDRIFISEQIKNLSLTHGLCSAYILWHTFNTALGGFFDDFILIVFDLEIFKNIQERLSVAILKQWSL